MEYTDFVETVRGFTKMVCNWQDYAGFGKVGLGELCEYVQHIHAAVHALGEF